MKQKSTLYQNELKSLLVCGVLLFVLVSSACKRPVMCGSKLIAQSASPNATTKASLYVENCGATTRDITQVNIHPASQDLKPDKEGRISEGLALNIRGYHQVEMIWEDDENLLVKCLSCAPDTFHKITNTLQGINIKFQIK